MSNFKCGACKWWDPDPTVKDPSNLGEGAIIGTCRRLPPVALVMWIVDPKTDSFQPSKPQMVQPITGKNDWCGEWKAKLLNANGGNA